MKIILNLLFIGVTVSGCATMNKDFKGLSYKSLEFTKKPDFKKELTVNEFQKDILLLRYGIEKGYGAKGTISESIFRKVDEALSHLTYTSDPIVLCKEIGKILSLFPDHHLKAQYRGKNCFDRKVNKVNVGHNLNKSEAPWKGFKEDNDTYTIAISKFSPGKWPGFHSFVDEAIQKAKTIIIDLRDNGGGDDSIGYQLAEKLAGQKVGTPIAPDVKRNSLDTLILWDNYLNVLKKSSQDPNMREQLESYINQNRKKKESVLNGELEEFTSSTSKEDSKWKYDSSKGFQGKIFILQNQDCGSSGESTIDFFEYFPNVTKVGRNTKGMIHFGNIGIVVLPYSSIQINIPTKANKYKDGRFIEFIGIKPDVLLEDGRDAYRYVLNELERN